jgi:hypothetical protein
MARVPKPAPGLIFRYGYLWLAESQSGRIDSSKDRASCIIARVAEGGDVSLKISGGAKLEPGDVIVFPITRRPPASDVITVELTADDKRVCGLDPEEPSWVVVSEFNADTWPNADLSLVPGTDKFEYGMAPPGLLKRIGQKFIEARRLQRIIGVKR